MRPTRTWLTVLLVFGLAVPAHAQDEPARYDPIRLIADGLQSSLVELYHGTAETLLGHRYREAIRKRMLFDEDIHMRLVTADAGHTASAGGWGETDEDSECRDPICGIFWIEGPSEGSIDAEFDWQNKAMSMRLRDSGGENTYAASVRRRQVGSKLETEETDITIYFDAVGNVYVPVRQEVGGTRYVSVSLPGLLGDMADVLEVNVDHAIEAGVTEMVDRLAAIAPERYGQLLHGNRYLERWAGTIHFDTINGEWETEGDITQDLLEGWVQQIRAQLELLKVFPPLIHFAFVFSPAGVRAYADDVHEEPNITWRGWTQYGAVTCVDCTRFTVTEGKQAGYVLIFDRFGRLVHLRDTDGDTATYGYHKDVTVP